MTFRDYMKEENTISFENMDEIYEKMLNEIETDSEARELYTELVKKANAYAQIRSNWCFLSTKEKQDTDEKRTMTHDSLIVKFNQLARYLKQIGKMADWRDDLGEERKRIGDMGCYISFVSALSSR